jgi:hypothetical protein
MNNKGQTMELETRVALLEVENKQRHSDMIKLGDAISDLAVAVKELNQWQASLRYPLSGIGFIFVGLLTAAGYGVWNFIKSLSV